MLYSNDSFRKKEVNHLDEVLNNVEEGRHPPIEAAGIFVAKQRRKGNTKLGSIYEVSKQ